MLDLSKPYGVHENAVLYGDHENPKIIYYLPNQVGLAPVEDENGGDRTYDFFLQIFKEENAIEGGIDELEGSAGAIMSLGVQCTLSPEKLEKIKSKLQGENDLPEDIFFSIPEWQDGSIDLIVLDVTTQDETSFDEDAFVESIIGSKKPSLTSSDLRAIFNVRLGRKGAALIASTLQGDRSSVAGVLYDLKFRAIRPALDLIIEADLDRCHEKVSELLSAGVSINYYVTISASAEFEAIKEKLIEDGDIKVEVISQVENEEMRKMIDETVNDFKDKVMRELFRPMVNPATNIELSMGDMVPQIGVAFSFKEQKNFHNKKIRIDYRERSTTLKTHNPQAHLWLLGLPIKGQLDLYTKTVNFGELWRENFLEATLLHDFNEEPDLLMAEVLIWRKKAGKKSLTKTGGFNIPEDTSPLANFSFTKDKTGEQKIAWITEKGESSGYYYQVKFSYKQNIENVKSPAEIFSEVRFSSSQDLIIIPQVLVPFRHITFKYGSLDPAKISRVDIIIRSKDEHGTQLNREILSLDHQHKEEVFKIRNHPFDKPYLEEERHFHFADGRPLLKQDNISLIDEEIIITDPFGFNKAHIIPLVTGANADKYLEILLNLTYQSSDQENVFETKKLIRGKAPDFAMEEIFIPVLNKGDKVGYEFSAITAEGDLVELESGSIEEGPLILRTETAEESGEILIKWEGPPPAHEDLDYVRVEFRLLKDNGESEDLEKVQFSGESIPKDLKYKYLGEGKLLKRVIKRSISGSKEKGDFTPVTSKEIVVGI